MPALLIPVSSLTSPPHLPTAEEVVGGAHGVQATEPLRTVEADVERVATWQQQREELAANGVQPPERGFKRGKVYRFSQVLGESRLATGGDVRLHAVARERDRATRILLLQRPHEVQTTAVRKAEITDDHVERSLLRSRPRRCHRRSPGHAVPEPTQQPAHHLQRRLVILDQ